MGHRERREGAAAPHGLRCSRPWRTVSALQRRSAATACGCSGELWRWKEEVEAKPMVQHEAPGGMEGGARVRRSWGRREKMARRRGGLGLQGHQRQRRCEKEAVTGVPRLPAAVAACGGRRGSVGTRLGGGGFGERRRTGDGLRRRTRVRATHGTDMEGEAPVLAGFGAMDGRRRRHNLQRQRCGSSAWVRLGRRRSGPATWRERTAGSRHGAWARGMVSRAGLETERGGVGGRR
uniref:Uncharacterized protein n=1 Tax=Oryza punctata TaxID=4537 RepID=A0A0E0LB40_ORYPU